jgi:hypothetical protein
MNRQAEISTPAKLRTWIQAYDVRKYPSMPYTSKEIEAQVNGLFDAGLTNGYMTWNSTSSIDRYRKQIEAYKKDYK